MTSKHTPGPWHPPHFTDSETKCNCGHIFSEHQEHMGSVCTVKWDPTDMGFDAQRKAEAIANAHLISAAPDMYEALKDLVTSVEALRVGGLDKEIELARAALSKAEAGGQ